MTQTKWKSNGKKKHKISLCSKYSEGHFKKLQPPLAAGALLFAHAGRKLGTQINFALPLFPKAVHLCLSYLSVVRPVLPSPAPLWNPRELCWRLQNDILPPLPPFREDNHHPGEWDCRALIRTSGQIKRSSQVDFLNKQPYTQLFSRLPGYCTLLPWKISVNSTYICDLLLWFSTAIWSPSIYQSILLVFNIKTHDLTS